MATTKNVGSQLTNLLTYNNNLTENISLAKNVFPLENAPKSIDLGYMNDKLIYDGVVAWFVDEDEELNKTLYALPFNVLKKKKPYNSPYDIEAVGEGGYRKKLKYGEYVLMYDNTEKRPIITDIYQYSERMSICDRTSDINILQQRTPRIWSVPEDKEKTFKDLINNIDAFQETVVGYEDLNIQGVNCILQPAPYVADKVDEHKSKIYNEFLSFIGITTITYDKKERLITSEVEAQIGGSVAKRFSRYEPRLEAIKEINEKFKDYLEKPLVVGYYDGIPKSNESEVNDDVSNVSNVSNTNGDSERLNEK